MFYLVKNRGNLDRAYICGMLFGICYFILMFIILLRFAHLHKLIAAGADSPIASFTTGERSILILSAVGCFVLFFLLPLTLYWLFFLCAGWKDPFRARLWGVAAGVLMQFLLETYSFILHTVTLAQGTNPTALFITADFRQKALFLLIALAMTALMWLGYLPGPFRLVRRKWKDVPEEEDED